MDKAAAVNHFSQNIGRLARLPLITDQEMELLFGAEVAATLEQLSILDRQDRICSSCGDKCCRLVKCELYSSRFDMCPIHDLRPALCRMHYCRDFPLQDLTVKELGDIFFESLAAAQARGDTRAGWFDSPPLAAGCPELVKAASQWLEAVETGELNPQRAARLIREEAEKHRMPDETGQANRL